MAEQLGTKFVFSQVDPGSRSAAVKKTLMTLFQSKVCSRVVHTSANGLPLGAESNEKFFKALMIDIGLVSVQLGLSSVKRSKLDRAVFSNRGGLAEQFVGQQLRAGQSPIMDPQLYYWHQWVLPRRKHEQHLGENPSWQAGCEHPLQNKSGLIVRSQESRRENLSHDVAGPVGGGISEKAFHLYPACEIIERLTRPPVFEETPSPLLGRLLEQIVNREIWGGWFDVILSKNR